MAEEGKRAFAVKLQANRYTAAEARQKASLATQQSVEPVDNDASTSAQAPSAAPPTEVIDYEEVLLQKSALIEADKLKDILLVSNDELCIKTVGREYRTVRPPVPKETLDASDIESHIKICVDSSVTEWSIVDNKSGKYSRSREPVTPDFLPLQVFEIDVVEQERKEQEEKDKHKSAQDHLQAMFKSPGSPAPQKSLRVSQNTEGRKSPLPIHNILKQQTDETVAFEFGQLEHDGLHHELLNYVKGETERTNAKNRSQDRHQFFQMLMDTDGSDVVSDIERPDPEPYEEHVGRQILVECKELKFQLDEVEPYYAAMALYLVTDKVKKISETFHFDLNTPDIAGMLGAFAMHKEFPSIATQAIFSVTYPNAEIYRVIRIEKVLQGDIALCAEPYVKDAGNQKAAQNHRQVAGTFCSRLGNYRMPFAWGALPLFDLVETSEPGIKCPLFRQEGEKLSDDDLYKFLSEYRKGTMARKLKSIPGHLSLTIRELKETDEQLPGCLSPSLVPVKPFPESTANLRPIREIYEFHSTPVYAVASTYLHHLYVYPTSVNLGNRGATIKARNIACRAEIYDDDQKQATPLRCIYGKSSMTALTNNSTTAVTYHNKAPDFYEEVKIALPAKITARHHIRFTFFHVSCQPPKKAHVPESVDTPIGYAWMPLLAPDGRLISEEHMLPIACELSPKYLADGPDIKWVDGKKPLFKVIAVPASTIISEDAAVNAFLQQSFVQLPADAAPKDEEPLVKAIQRLWSPDTQLQFVIQMLPQVLNQLIGIICRPSQNDVLAKEAFLAIVRIVSNVHSKDSVNRNPLINTYSSLVFSTPASKKSAHEEIIKQLIAVLKEGNLTTVSEVLKYLWFYFDIICKSMIQTLFRSGRHKLNRKERFPLLFQISLRTLVEMLSAENQRRTKTMVTVASRLNQSLAFFLRDLLAFMDRGFVFSMVQKHIEDSSRESDASGDTLMELKFEFLRILCSSEHYLALNLPVEEKLVAENLVVAIPECKKRHYLAGLLISEVTSLFDHPNKPIRKKAIRTLRDLIAKLDADDRLQTKEHKARIARLHFPVVPIVLDNFKKLVVHPEGDDSKVPVDAFDHEERRALLGVYLYILKHIDTELLRHWWKKEAVSRLWAMFDVLSVCVKAFDYPGKAKVANRQPNTSMLNASITSVDAKRALEETYTNIGSGRNLGRASIQAGVGTFRAVAAAKDSVRRFGTLKKGMQLASQPTKARDAAMDARLEGCICAESSLVGMDVLELFAMEHPEKLAPHGGGEGKPTIFMEKLFGLLLDFLRTNQGEKTLLHVFASLRSFLNKFPAVLFIGTNDFCADLTSAVLRHCNSGIVSTREQASAFMYLMIRKNTETTGRSFAKVKLQSTIALSRIVGSSEIVRGQCLQRALSTIAAYAAEDKAIATNSPFPSQVRDLCARLYTILRDTVRMKANDKDSDMLVDIMYRLAQGYANSPDLRVTWLENLAQYHKSTSNWAEAAQCTIHIAALVAEYLNIIDFKRGLPQGCASFQNISPNVLEESAVSEDVMPADGEGICESKLFSEDGLRNLLEQAISELEKAELYEVVNEVYKLLLPIYQKERAYGDLATAHRRLASIFDSIQAVTQSGKRLLGSYFRVGFYGAKLGELDGKEFIYKEPKITHLSEISLRLQGFYRKVFGDKFFEIIQDSNEVVVANLDPEKAYAQITFVEPYFDEYELKDRITQFERLHNLRRFIFDTPFTDSGKAHGSIDDQKKRKTILTVEAAFPYLKRRIQVIDRHVTVLSPIECAIEEIQGKAGELNQAVQLKPPNIKLLQMVLQGSVSATVNQGPMEMATVFLGTRSSEYPVPMVKKLRLHFNKFIKHCGEALELNEALIKSDQFEYQNDLRMKYRDLRERLSPYIMPERKEAASSVFSNRRSGQEGEEQSEAFVSKEAKAVLDFIGGATPEAEKDVISFLSRK
eukprot:Opistho-2@78585